MIELNQVGKAVQRAARLRTSPFQVIAFMVTRSNTPSKVDSAPMGICTMLTVTESAEGTWRCAASTAEGKHHDVSHGNVAAHEQL